MGGWARSVVTPGHSGTLVWDLDDVGDFAWTASSIKIEGVTVLSLMLGDPTYSLFLWLIKSYPGHLDERKELLHH